MDHQTKFIASIMGGPAAMSDDRLEHVHRKLDVTTEEFDEILNLLSEAMDENGMEEEDILSVTRVFNTKRGLIVARAV